MGMFGITDAEYATWLKKAGVRVVLADLVAHHDGAPVSRYLTNFPFITRPIDSPPNQPYADAVLELPGFEARMSEAFTGRSMPSWGEMVIYNPNGMFDSWLEDGWDGRAVTLRIGAPTWNLPDFRPLLTGVVADIDAPARDTLAIKLRDKTHLFDKPIQTTLIGGTTANKDQPVPLAFGQCFNVEPVLIAAATHTYQVHDGQIEAITAVRDGGDPVAYTPNLAAGTFTLSAQPIGRITADVKGAKPAGTWLRTVGEIVQYLATAKAGLTTAEMETLAEATNKFLCSETIASGFGAWLPTNTINTINQALAPNGTLTATLVVPSTDNIGHTTQFNSSVAINAAGTWTMCIYAKPAGYKRLAFRAYDGTSYFINVTFDIDAGVIIANPGGVASIRPVGTAGWFKLRCVGVSVAGSTPAFDVQNDTTTAQQAYAGDGVSGVYLWGAHCHPGSIEVPYVPALTADIATRAAGLHLVTGDGFVVDTPLGRYIKDRTNLIDVIDDLVRAVGAFWTFSRPGQLYLGRLDAPAGTPVMELTADDIEADSLSMVARDLPQASVRLGFQKNWTPQDADALAGIVTETNRALYAAPYSVAKATNAVTTKHLLAPNPDATETLIVASSDATTEATRRAGLCEEVRSRVRFTTFPRAMSLHLGDVIRLTHPRFGYAAGELAVVVGIRERVLDARVELEVWK